MVSRASRRGSQVSSLFSATTIRMQMEETSGLEGMWSVRFAGRKIGTSNFKSCQDRQACSCHPAFRRQKTVWTSKKDPVSLNQTK